MRIHSLIATAAAILISASNACAAHKWGLKTGTPDLQSAGQLAFGPDGILIVADPKGAALFAIDTGDMKAGGEKAAREIDKLGEKLTEALGGSPAVVNDLAVNPLSGTIYLSVTKDNAPAIATIDAAGKISELSLKDVPFQKATLPNPPEDKVTGEGPRARNRRNEAVTDVAYADGKVLVSGVSGNKNASTVREFAFPLNSADDGTNVEIYHAAHGKVEDNAAIRTFVSLSIDGKPSLLAGFTCTPLVRMPLADLEPGKKVRGTTVAELGNRNTPLDMIVYEKGGEKFVLMTNTARGVMKISTKDIGREKGLTEPVSGGGTAGQTFEKIDSLDGAVQLDRLGEDQAVVVIKQGDSLALKTVALP